MKVYRIYTHELETSHLVTGVAVGQNEEDALHNYLANNPEAEDGVYRVSEGPGDMPRVANELGGVGFKFENGLLMKLEKDCC